MGRRIVKKNGARARISDTSVDVCDVVSLIQGAGEQIYSTVCRVYPFLTINDIRMVQEYYRNNEEEIASDLAGEEV